MKAESIVHTIFSQLDTSVSRKQKREYTCSIRLGRGGERLQGIKAARLGVMLGGLKLVEDERVNRKLLLTISGNTEVLGAVVGAVSPIGRSLWRSLRCLPSLTQTELLDFERSDIPLFVSLTQACSFLFNV